MSLEDFRKHVPQPRDLGYNRGRKIRWFSQLNPLERLIKRTLDAGMEQGNLFTVTYRYGFELDCYEDWCGVWDVEGRGVKVTHKYLDDAIRLWAKKVKPIDDTTV